MKQLALGIAALSLIFTACKKNDTPAGKEEWYLSQIIEDGDTSNLKYNTDNKLKEINGHGMNGNIPYFYTIQPVYESGKLTKVMESNSADPTPKASVSVLYLNDRVARVDHFGRTGGLQDWVLIYSDTVIYNAQGKVSELKSIHSTYTSIYRATWENDNVTKIDRYSIIPGQPEQLTVTTKLTYDNKTNMNKLFNDNLMWIQGPEELQKLSANNVLVEETFNGTALRERNTRTYTYNEWNQIAVEKTKNERVINGTTITDEYETKFVFAKK